MSAPLASSALEIGLLVEDPSLLPAPRPPLMKRMCQGRPRRECGLVLGWVTCVPEMAGKISHGMCEGCAELAAIELEELLGMEGAALENLLDGGGASSEPQAVPPSQAESIAGAGEALARPAVQSSFDMSATPTSPTPRPGLPLPVKRVAEICHLEVADIYRAKTPEMGSPGHFVYPLNATQESYTLEGLCCLVQGLQIMGKTMAAEVLDAEIGRLRKQETPPPPPPAAPASTARPGGWLAEYEARQEDAA